MSSTEPLHPDEVEPQLLNHTSARLYRTLWWLVARQEDHHQEKESPPEKIQKKMEVHEESTKEKASEMFVLDSAHTATTTHTSIVVQGKESQRSDSNTADV